MDSTGAASLSPGPEAALVGSDAEQDSVSGELPSTDPGKLPALPVGPRANPEASASGSLGCQALLGDIDPKGMQSCGAKIPNRDSGIDSPSCSVAGEPFPCEEGGAPGLHPDSDIGEGSNEEPDHENRSSKTNKTDEADVAKVSAMLGH